MKKLTHIFLFIPLVMVGCYSISKTPSQGYDRSYDDNSSYNDYSSNYDNADYNRGVSYQVFYDQLQPYGNWINYPGHGYVWQPDADASFRPYETNGRWISTVDGWAWASDYSWGWAPFHYGRWLNEPGIGWMWVPGYEWAPAWVTWGSFNDYYAWAPLAPGINISMGRSWRAPYNYWSCVPRNRFYNSNFNRYVVRPSQYNVENNITIINNYNTYNNNQYYNKGPEYQEVERFSNRKITPVQIASANRPGATRINGKQMQIFRPTVTNNTAIKNAAPSRVTTVEGLRSNAGKRIGPVNGSQLPSVQQGAGLERANNTLNNRVRNGGGILTNGATTESTIEQNNGLQNRNRIKLPPANSNTDVYNRTQPENRSGTQRSIIGPQQLPSTDQLGNTQRGAVIRELQRPENSERINNNRRVLESNRLLQNNSQPARQQPVFQSNPNRNAAEQNTNRATQQPSRSMQRIENAQQNINRNSQIQRPQSTSPSRVIVRPRQ